MSYTTPAATRKLPSEIIPLSTGTCPADWRAWAQMFLKATPWTYERRSSKQEWEQKALRQGHIAVNSILRDWIKGQVTAVECGILSFEAVFMPHMITNDGRPLLERMQELLPEADEPKVVQIPHKPNAA